MNSSVDMKRSFLISAFAVLSAFSSTAREYTSIEPDATYLYAEKDSTLLYMDVYEPSADSVSSLDGAGKPTVLFMFGGGFKSGRRDDLYFNEWFKSMTDAGYRIVSIDYRLGLSDFSGAGINMKFINALDAAIDLAVEDLFSATNFIIQNAGALGIDPADIVISGSSAGAISVMQAEWEICNSADNAKVLPENFNYAGVMSFSGAVFSRKGSVRYKKEPCPTVMFHGTDDKIVPYNKIQFLNLCFSGSSETVKDFKRHSYSYAIYRIKGHSHEISTFMNLFTKEEFDFIENCVMKKLPAAIDITVDNPDIPFPDWAKGNDYKDLY